MSFNFTISKEYKKKTTKAILSILLFFIVFIALTLLVFALSAICIISGLFLIAVFPKFLTIMLGIGIISIGVFLIIFLLKFIFQKSSSEDSYKIQITESDEPKLFQLINDISSEIGTKLPKKVFLTPNVNAAAYFNSNILSLFLPSKKNLIIGLGLINSVTIEELKSILSHEFAHFSQKTMIIGNYINNFNKLIYNLLYENESYERLIIKWSELNAVFELFTIIAVFIINKIQWILEKLFIIINKSNSKLMKEMEYNADEIASYVIGNKVFEKSLLRIRYSSDVLNKVIEFYFNRIDDNIASSNLYKDQIFLMKFIAKNQRIIVRNNLPDICIENYYNLNLTKFEIINDFDSHPSISERIKSIKKINSEVNNINYESANSLLSNAEELQKQFTEVYFAPILGNENINKLEPNEFEQLYVEEFKKESLNEIFNGYYDLKGPVKFNLEKLPKNDYDEKIELKDLFSDEKVTLVTEYFILKNDIKSIDEICTNNDLNINEFLYEGEHYTLKECNQLFDKINHIYTDIENKIKDNDKRIFIYLSNLEILKFGKSNLQNYYEDYFQVQEDLNKKYSLYDEVFKASLFINNIIPLEEIKSKLKDLNKLERKLQNEMKQLLDDEYYLNFITNDIKDNIEKYLSRGDWRYFLNNNYLNFNIEIFANAVEAFRIVIEEVENDNKIKLLNYQVEIINSL